jgi:hypothetical protein
MQSNPAVQRRRCRKRKPVKQEPNHDRRTTTREAQSDSDPQRKVKLHNRVVVHRVVVHRVVVHQVVVHQVVVHQVAVHQVAVHQVAVHQVAVHQVAVHRDRAGRPNPKLATLAMRPMHCGKPNRRLSRQRRLAIGVIIRLLLQRRCAAGAMSRIANGSPPSKTWRPNS